MLEALSFVCGGAERASGQLLIAGPGWIHLIAAESARYLSNFIVAKWEHLTSTASQTWAMTVAGE